MNGILASLRIARRDILRHRLRSILIIALVALPIAALAFAAVVYRSSAGVPADRADAELGRVQDGGADAWIAAPVGAGRAWQDNPELPDSFGWEGGGDEAGGRRPAQEVRALLPPGVALTPFSWANVPAQLPGGRFIQVRAEMLDLSGPAAQGRFAVTAGRTATAPGEVAVSDEVLKSLRARPGDVLRIGSPSVPLTVVGTVRCLLPNQIADGCMTVVAAQEGLAAGQEWRLPTPRYLMKGASLDRAQVAALNGVGLAVFSRAVATAPTVQVDAPGSSDLLAAVVVLGVTLAALQVVFLAGPAFAIGARRMRRQLALVGAAGGSPAQLRTVVLAGGAVLGAVGAVIG